MIILQIIDSTLEKVHLIQVNKNFEQLACAVHDKRCYERDSKEMIQLLELIGIGDDDFAGDIVVQEQFGKIIESFPDKKVTLYWFFI